MSSVVGCLLALQEHIHSSNASDNDQKTLAKFQSEPVNGRGSLECNSVEAIDVQLGEQQTNGEKSSVGLKVERNKDGMYASEI